MPERPVPFSLLDAARVVARGGTFDDKLAALADQVRAATDAGSVAFLLHDADADVLLSLDGELALPVSAADGLAALQISLAAMESAQSGQVITLDPLPEVQA